jgi:L-lactate dehydrogenase complex protein LldF
MTIPTGKGVVWLDTPPFPQAAQEALQNGQLRANLRRATSSAPPPRSAISGCRQPAS